MKDSYEPSSAKDDSEGPQEDVEGLELPGFTAIPLT